MRLFFPALLGLLALAAGSSIVGVVPTLELTEGYIRAQTVGFIASDDVLNRCSADRPCVDGACCNSDGKFPHHDCEAWMASQPLFLQLYRC
jgi:hypothetical protein